MSELEAMRDTFTRGVFEYERYVHKAVEALLALVHRVCRPQLGDDLGEACVGAPGAGVT